DGGPAGGILVAGEILANQGASRLIILAVDAPSIRPEDLSRLLESPSPGAVYAGLPLPMAIDLKALPPGLASSRSLRQAVADAGLAVIPPQPGVAERLRGANTPEELTRLKP